MRQTLAAWSIAESGRFILFLPVFMAAGILTYFALPTEPPLWPAALLTLAALAAAPFARTAPLQAAALTLAFAGAGFASAGRATWAAPPWPDLPNHATIAAGQVAAIDTLPEGRRVSLASPSLDGAPPQPRTLRIRLRDTDTTPLQPGDRITVRALLRPPSPPATPDGWDTQRDAFFAGIGGYGFALGPATRMTATAPSSWQGLRQEIAARILAALPGAKGAIAATLLTGLSTAIPPEDRAAFQASGLAHLLAVAGLHIGIVMGLAYAGTRRALTLSEYAALFWPTKAIASLAALAVGALYLALTGAHLPILRSFAMACVVALAVLTGRRALSWRALALAAIVIMLAAPAQVLGVSFQMSFSAVMALIAGWEILSPRLARLRLGGMRGAALRHIAALVAASVLAGTACLPVAAYHFGTLSPWYVPANLVAVPLTAVWVLPWGMAALLLMPLGLHGLALAPMGWGISALLWIAHTVAGWPASVVALPQMPPAALLAMMAGLVWLCLWRTRLRLAGLGAVAAGIAIAVFSPRPDIFVSSDARLIAARIGGAVYVSAAKGVSRFDREAPSRLWGVKQTTPFPDQSQAEGGALACTAPSCRITLRSQAALLLRDASAPCGQAAAILSHLRLSCRVPAATILDRMTAEAAGAATLRLTGTGAVLRTVAAARGTRPWVQAAPPAEPRLPPAETE